MTAAAADRGGRTPLTLFDTEAVATGAGLRSTGLDFDLFVTAFEAGEPEADFDGDGFSTGDDFDAFVAAFELGC